MPLDKEDWDRLKDLFAKQKSDLETSFSNALQVHGKRIDRLEAVVGRGARAARTALVSAAKVNHGEALRCMFDEATLVLITPLEEGPDRKLTRPPATSSIEDIRRFVADAGSEVKLEVENGHVGYRILVHSFSAQTRRRVAAKFLKDHKKAIRDQFGLLLQYDKPLVVREMQKNAHKFMSLLQQQAGAAVRTKSVKGGHLFVNDVKLAPEYLIPVSSRWNPLIELLADRIAAWGMRAPRAGKDGIFFDVFGAEYAAGLGVFDLTDLPLEEFE
jgi:hypothetical protein